MTEIELSSAAPALSRADAASVQPGTSSRGGSKATPLKTPTRRRRTRSAGTLELYFVIAVPFAFLVTFNYWPMVGAQIAFRNYNPVQGMFGSPWIGLTEFRHFIESPYFSIIIHNTLTFEHLLLGHWDRRRR